MSKLSHIDSDNRPTMVDVSDKQAAAFWDALEEAIKPVKASQPRNVLEWASERTDPQTWFQNLASEALVDLVQDEAAEKYRKREQRRKKRRRA